MYISAAHVVHSLISSRIDYCNSLLYGMSDRSIGRLQKIQNTAARILTLSPRHCHISEILKRLHWLKVKFRIKYNISIRHIRLTIILPQNIYVV